jgi:hypothetical protein
MPSGVTLIGSAGVSCTVIFGEEPALEAIFAWAGGTTGGGAALFGCGPGAGVLAAGVIRRGTTPATPPTPPISVLVVGAGVPAGGVLRRGTIGGGLVDPPTLRGGGRDPPAALGRGGGGRVTTPAGRGPIPNDVCIDAMSSVRASSVGS